MKKHKQQPKIILLVLGILGVIGLIALSLFIAPSFSNNRPIESINQIMTDFALSEDGQALAEDYSPSAVEEVCEDLRQKLEEADLGFEGENCWLYINESAIVTVLVNGKSFEASANYKGVSEIFSPTDELGAATNEKMGIEALGSRRFYVLLDDQFPKIILEFSVHRWWAG